MAAATDGEAYYLPRVLSKKATGCVSEYGMWPWVRTSQRKPSAEA